jgi:hypothetical protein
MSSIPDQPWNDGTVVSPASTANATEAGSAPYQLDYHEYSPETTKPSSPTPEQPIKTKSPDSQDHKDDYYGGDSADGSDNTPPASSTPSMDASYDTFESFLTEYKRQLEAEIRKDYEASIQELQEKLSKAKSIRRPASNQDADTRLQTRLQEASVRRQQAREAVTAESLKRTAGVEAIRLHAAKELERYRTIERRNQLGYVKYLNPVIDVLKIGCMVSFMYYVWKKPKHVFLPIEENGDWI